MDRIQTMAVKITKKTHPLAVAVLAGGFARIPFSRAEGSYLVINEIAVRSFKETGARPNITIENCWMSARLFHKNYKFIGTEKKNELVPVRLKD